MQDADELPYVLADSCVWRAAALLQAPLGLEDRLPVALLRSILDARKLARRPGQSLRERDVKTNACKHRRRVVWRLGHSSPRRDLLLPAPLKLFQGLQAALPAWEALTPGGSKRDGPPILPSIRGVSFSTPLGMVQDKA